MQSVTPAFSHGLRLRSKRRETLSYRWGSLASAEPASPKNFGSSTCDASA